MRLLDLVTGEFVEFNDPSTTPPDAILSHRWDQREQTYQDIRYIQNVYQRTRQSSSPPSPYTPQIPSNPSPPPSIWDSDSGLSDKVRGACETARKDGFRYLWIDSCCIDKTSSSELSESINSMFAWYCDAAVCYAFLSDVPTLPAPALRAQGSSFRSSVWFTRGWTLQELIAPARLVFFSRAWEPLGTKAGLAALVEEITGIPISVLTQGVGDRGLHPSLDECSVAQRMSWAANRTTTKVEDQAYSLLGIFDIQMSTLYGEGGRAFRRLQEELLRRIPDQSIFAWGPVYPDALPQLATPPDPDIKASGTEMLPKHLPSSEPRRRYTFTSAAPSPILAHSPRDFAGAGKVVPVPHTHFVDLLTRYWPIAPQEYTSTPHGIRTALPLLPLATCLPPSDALFEAPGDAQRVRWYLAVLACEQSSFPGELLARICHVAAPERPVNVLHGGALRRGESGPHARAPCGLVRLAPLNEPWLVQLRVHTVFLDHPARALPPTSFMPRVPDARPDEPEAGTFTFTLPTWCRDALAARGYAASLEGPTPSSGEGEGGAYRLMLSPYSLAGSSTGAPESKPALFRWSVAADFSCERPPGTDGAGCLRILAAVHAAGSGVRHTQQLEWLHVSAASPFPGWHWHCRLMRSRLALAAESHETVALELGVQLVSASCYHVHADIVSQLPAE